MYNWVLVLILSNIEMSVKNGKVFSPYIHETMCGDVIQWSLALCQKLNGCWLKKIIHLRCVLCFVYIIWICFSFLFSYYNSNRIDLVRTVKLI